MAFDKVTYFENIATNLVDIGHTSETKKFFRASGTGDFFEMLESGLNTSGRILIIDESQNGRFTDQRSDNLLDRQVITFWVIENHSAGDFDSREAVKKNCKASAKKILARMFRDQKLDWQGASPQSGLKDLDRGSVLYATITAIGDNYSGVMITIDLVEKASCLFDTDDWLDE